MQPFPIFSLSAVFGLRSSSLGCHAKYAVFAGQFLDNIPITGRTVNCYRVHFFGGQRFLERDVSRSFPDFHTFCFEIQTLVLFSL